MKKSILILVLLAILSGSAATAQQKPHTSYLLLTVYDESNGLFRSTEKIVVSHQDGHQDWSEHSMRAYMYGPERFKEEEDSILPRLQPYFDSGWKLISVTSVPLPASAGSIYYNVLTRYFLSRED